MSTRLFSLARIVIDRTVVTLDDSGLNLPALASQIVHCGRFQPEPLVFLRSRTLVRVVRSPVVDFIGGTLLEAVPVSLDWLRHVAIARVATLRWSDGREVPSLPEPLARMLLNDAPMHDFWPVLHVHGRPVSAAAKVAALAAQGEGWHLFTNGLVRLRHPPPLVVVAGSDTATQVQERRRNEVKERLVQLCGGWRHSRFTINCRRSEEPGHDAIRHELGLTLSRESYTKVLRRLASSCDRQSVRGYRQFVSPYDTPVVQAVTQFGIIDHWTSLRLVDSRRCRARAILFQPYDYGIERLLGNEFEAVLRRFGLAMRVIANTPHNPNCVGLLLFGVDDSLVRERLEASPEYIKPIE